jgi:hypothetical protein
MNCGTRQGGWYLLLVALVCFANTAIAVEGKKARGEFGVVIGSLGGMTVEVTSKDDGSRGSDIETESGFSGGIFFEQKALGPIWMGMTLDYYEVRGKMLSFLDESPKTLGLALRVSGRLRSNNGLWVFRPGIASGVVLLGQVGYLKTSQHVMIKPFVETVYRVSPKVGLVGEISVFSTVWGANDDYNILAGPTTLIRFGIVM